MDADGMEMVIEGGTVIVDAADYEELSRYRWRVRTTTTHGTRHIAVRSQLPGEVRGQVAMARHLLGLRRGDRKIADHVNGNTLDNRRSNLRIASPAESAANTKIKSNRDWKCVGKYGKKFYGAVQFHRERYSVGAFRCPTAAALAVDKKARELHGNFGTYNLPKPGERSAIDWNVVARRRESQ